MINGHRHGWQGENSILDCNRFDLVSKVMSVGSGVLDLVALIFSTVVHGERDLQVSALRFGRAGGSFWFQSLRHAAPALPGMPQDVDTQSTQSGFVGGKRSLDCLCTARAAFAARHRTHVSRGAHNGARDPQKKSQAAHLSFSDTLLPAIKGDALEIDELVIDLQRRLWLVIEGHNLLRIKQIERMLDLSTH